jgi:Fe-S-cluster containining protein
MLKKTTKDTSKKKTSSDPNWWKQGVRFECQGSGQCCTSHGEYGYVFLSKTDRIKIAKFLGLKTPAFTKKYCTKLNGAFHLNEDPKNTDCMFLKNKRCEIYSARPSQCRTWPFWPEVMPAKTWNKEVLNFCPGIGKGAIVPIEKIEKQLSEMQQTEDMILKEAMGATHFNIYKKTLNAKSKN